MSVKFASGKATRHAEELGLLTSQQLVAASGISYRLIDYYTVKGYIKPVHDAQGSGSARLFSPDVLGVLARIKACPLTHGTAS